MKDCFFGFELPFFSVRIKAATTTTAVKKAGKAKFTESSS